MMLHRSASTQRRRASRGPVGTAPISSGAPPGGRRASLATESPIALMQTGMERQRSPRSSIVPNIALDRDIDTMDEIPPDPNHYNASLLDIRTSRNSLKPTDYYRTSRNSLVPETARRSPRNSFTPEVSLSARNSLVSSDTLYPRNSLAHLSGSRTSLMPENGGALVVTRSPRHSLVPDVPRSPRGSVTNLELLDRSPRGSICPEMGKSPRGSITPLDVDRSPRGSIVSECFNHSPRGSIAAEANRSPRGSICPPDSNCSPRGSIVSYQAPRNRSPRGSMGVNEIDRHSRGSITGENEEEATKSPRGSIGLDVIDRSPRCSLGGADDRRSTKGSLPLQEFRRASGDQGISGNRCSSPYRQKVGNSSSVRLGGSNAQPNLGYGPPTAPAESRRASSSVSQFSGDESRRLCTGGAVAAEKGYRETANLGVATYGSVVFQLKDAHLEANNTCDFVFRALGVVSRTTAVSVLLACLCVMTLLMFIFGLQFSNDCPAENQIPMYMVIGGSCGLIYMGLMLFSQIRSKRTEVFSVPSVRKRMSPIMLISIPLLCFLVVWFILGNFWILHIMWPKLKRPLFAPNNWCHGTLYIFSLVHVCIVHGILAMILILAIGLALYRVFTCPFPESCST